MCHSCQVDGDSHKWIDAGNRGKTDDEPIRKKKKSRRSHSAPPFTKARRSSLPRVSLQERLDEITILRLFMMCHSYPKLLGLSKYVATPVSDPPKLHHFGRI
uniref:Uncharacterized protein n=1 Tax=Solanum tuberosum TaxID=4113 RepID=M1CBV7_SOLTU